MSVTLSRSLLSLRLIRKRPLLSVVLVPSTPIKDERAGNVLVLQDPLGEVRRCRRAISSNETVGPAVVDGLDEARVLDRKEALGNEDIENNRKHQGSDRHRHGEALMPEHPLQQPVIFRDEAIVIFLGAALEIALLLDLFVNGS